MTLAAFFAYCAAVILAAATPGPAVFATISTGISRGFLSGVLVGLGVAAADAVLVTLALAGLVTLVQTFEWVFWALKYAGAAYLVWLGVRMWRAAAAQGQSHDSSSAGGARPFLLGASIGLGNPKAILFHASIMPLILDLEALTVADCAAVVAVVAGVNIVVMGFYSGLSTATARFFRSKSRMRLISRVAGGAMIGTGALIASR